MNNLIEQSVGLFLLAWYVCSLDPLQRVLEWVAKRSIAFNVFVYPIFSCIHCASVWFVFIGLISGLMLPRSLMVAICCGFLVKNIKQVYNDYRDRNEYRDRRKGQGDD